MTKSLTFKQEAFCQAIAGGMNQSDAYREAYDASNMASVTIANEASLLVSNHDITVRLGELKLAASNQLAAVTLWTQEKFIAAAETQRQGAMASNQWAPANGALKLIGDATGLLAPVPERATVKITSITVVLDYGNGNQEQIPGPKIVEGTVVDAESAYIKQEG